MAKEKVSTIKNRLRKLRDSIVRLRDNGVCQYGARACCVKKVRGKNPITHVSHIFPVGLYRWMEFDVENCKLLCYFCHFRWWHVDPIHATFWFASYVDGDRMKYLMESVKTPIEITHEWLYEKEAELLMTIELLKLAGLMKGSYVKAKH